MRLIFATLISLLVWLSSNAWAAEKVDLALVLAVDCSGSVNPDEYRLQMNGIAAAFRDPAIISAATNGPEHRIAVNLLTWGDPDDKKFESGWHIISSAKEGMEFADTAANFTRHMDGGTGIGNAIAFGLILISDGTVQGSRRVIDVSGDGKESWELREPHFKLRDAQRLRALAGVTVNGLAIETDVKDLAQYYQDYVAAGPENFVMVVANYQQYAEAIRRKLLLEINPNVAELVHPSHLQ